MVALRMYFGTLEYTTVVLVEIYALPVITRLLTDSVSQNVITSSKGTGNNGLQLPEYFFDLAIEFVSNCAQVKPFRTVQHREMSEPSQFYKAAMQLRHKKINPKQQEVFYPAKYAVQARKIFQAKLLNFDPSEYNIFFVSLVDQEIH